MNAVAPTLTLHGAGDALSLQEAEKREARKGEGRGEQARATMRRGAGKAGSRAGDDSPGDAVDAARCLPKASRHSEDSAGAVLRWVGDIHTSPFFFISEPHAPPRGAKWALERKSGWVHGWNCKGADETVRNRSGGMKCDATLIRRPSARK